METRTYQIDIETSKAPEFIDITDQVLEFLRQSKISDGLAIIYSKHTTAAIRINENEPLLLQDMEDFIERISPRSGYSADDGATGPESYHLFGTVVPASGR